ncbi:MAG: YicC family protein [Phycisphaerae bacterium]|nr:YicC family protein [Phycisphaerae bacterium]
MIHSMTGFGETRLEAGDHAYHLEIRSVNNRYFKAAVHLPDDYAFLEIKVERLLRQRLTRGSLTLRLFVRDLSPQAALEINTAAVQAYLTHLRRMAGEDPQVSVDLATLLTLPGACQPREIAEAEQEQKWEILKRLIHAALERLIEMRATEGQALAEDLSSHCERMRTSLELIRARGPLVIEEYRDRLTARIAQLIADSSVQLAEEDLLKEVSIYADRSDISEELSRLGGHLEQFATLMAGSEPPGRKLEFIAQEMLREANTMGSKTGDATIAREIIEIKSAVDRIKEQVQNAE